MITRNTGIDKVIISKLRVGTTNFQLEWGIMEMVEFLVVRPMEMSSIIAEVIMVELWELDDVWNNTMLHHIQQQLG